MIEKRAYIVAIFFRVKRSVCIKVIPQSDVNRSAVVRTNAVAQIKPTTAEAVRLDLEIVIADIGCVARCLNIKLASGPESRGVAEVGVTFPRRTFQARVKATVAAA